MVTRGPDLASLRDKALLAYCTASAAYDAPIVAAWAHGIRQLGPPLIAPYI